MPPKFATAAAFVAGLVLLPLGALLIGLLGFLSVDGQSEPPGWEVAPARTAVHAALARQARGLVDPVKPDSEADLLAGLKMFRDDCAGCHGDYHILSAWGAKGFYPRVPQFGAGAAVLPAPQAFVAIKHGIRYSGMGAWEGMLKDRQIWQIATFLARRETLPPAVRARWQRTTR